MYIQYIAECLIFYQKYFISTVQYIHIINHHRYLFCIQFLQLTVVY